MTVRTMPATPSTWCEARRVGDRLLCGWRVPPVTGALSCRGELGTVVRDIGGKEFFAERADLYAEYPYDVDGPVYRMKSKARFPGKRARTTGSVSFRRGRRLPGAVGNGVDGWVPCSHRGHLNRLGGPPHPGTILPPFTGLPLISSDPKDETDFETVIKPMLAGRLYVADD